MSNVSIESTAAQATMIVVKYSVRGIKNEKGKRKSGTRKGNAAKPQPNRNLCPQFEPKIEDEDEHEYETEKILAEMSETDNNPLIQ